MYRDDQEALQARVESVSREAEHLRRENEALRGAVATVPANVVASTIALPAAVVYQSLDIQQLPLAERARLANHQLREFPVPSWRS